MPDLETWTEGCKDSNCKLFIIGNCETSSQF